MARFKLQRIVPYMLISSMLLTGCGKKSDCNLPFRHVHLYTKDINQNISLSTYYDDEHLERSGYNWTEDYMEINKSDEKFYKALNKKDLFNGVDNWDYLYALMAGHHDYLQFYYEYQTIEVYTETDSKGNTTLHTRTVTHSGWHSNPKDSDNTGKTRLCHHRYYGYRINYINGKYEVEKSPLVDDVRQIINDYPYFAEDNTEVVCEYYRFKRSELPGLSPDDFDVFNHPDLSNTSPNLGRSK